MSCATDATESSNIPFPTSYTIKYHTTPELVSVEQLKLHLRLLGAFRRLKEQIQSIRTTTGVASHLPQDTRWSVFVAMAVHRYELYLQRVFRTRKISGTAELPPVDVAMVHATYCLNPRWFQEDQLRSLPELTSLEGMLLDQFATSLDPSTFEQHVTAAQIWQWEQLTETPFSPIESFKTSGGRAVRWLHSDLELFAPWVTPQGTGYAQQGFRIDPPAGALTAITHETLGITKLARDIVKLKEVEYDKEGVLSTIAGTLFASNETSDARKSDLRVRTITKRLRGFKEFGAPTVAGVAAALDWSQVGARNVLKRLFPRSDRPLNNILSAYGRGEDFSLDLVSAVLRQGLFIDKMHDLGWTIPGRFDEGDLILKRSVARYHAFLDLVAAHSNTFMVPTLDIDLAWHTHQLSSKAYRDDTMKLVGRFIDHNDKVEEGVLADSFRETAAAWEACFGVPYSICGCFGSQSPSLARRLFTTRRAVTESHLIPSPSIQHEEGTHPLEHNSVLLITNAWKRRKSTRS